MEVKKEERADLDQQENKVERKLEVVLYSTHCPQCRMIEGMLKKKNIEYIEKTNIEEMKALGLMYAPVLSIDGQLFKGPELIKKINTM